MEKTGDSVSRIVMAVFGVGRDLSFRKYRFERYAARSGFDKATDSKTTEAIPEGFDGSGWCISRMDKSNSRNSADS